MNEERLAPKERKERRTFWVPTRELMSSNPQAEIYNEISYRRMSGMDKNEKPLYDQNLDEPLEICRIIGKRQGVVDGHTRLKFHYDRGDDYVECKDSTETLLRDPHIVNKPTDQDFLTISQYLKAVIEPTKVHVDIAPRRIAAHLMRGWDALIGEDLSQKVSLFVVLGILDRKSTLKRNPSGLERHLRQKADLPVAEPAEKDTLIRAMLEINQITIESQLSADKLRREVLDLIAQGQDVVGPNAFREVYALVHTDEVLAKIADVSDTDYAQQQATQELAETTRAAFSRVDETKYSEIVRILTAPILDYRQTLAVLKSPDISSTFHQEAYRSTVSIITRSYQKLKGSQEMSPLERHLIDSYAAQEYIHSRHETPSYALTDITSLHKKIITINDYCNHVDKSDELKVEGVDAATIDQFANLQQALEQLSFTDYHQISQGVTRLEVTWAQLDERVTNQRRLYWAQNIWGNSIEFHLQLRDLPTAHLRSRAIQYLADQPLSTLLNEENRRQLVATLESLGPDLLMSVLNGQMTLEAAKSRTDIKAPTPDPAQSRSPKGPRFIGRDQIKQPSPTPNIIYQPPIERKEITVRREQAAKILGEVQASIESLYLGPDHVDRALKTQALGLINMLGRVFDIHPDIIGALSEHQRLVERVAELNEELAERDSRRGSQLQ